MRRKILFFTMCVMGLGIAGAGVQFSERTDMEIVRAAQTDFDIDDKGTLTKYNGTDANVVIPDGVTAIGAEAFFCSSLSEITIPDSVTSIGEYAFGSCENLKEITLPGGITNIPPWAFESCSSLENIILPDSVEDIGDCAFWNCKSLTGIAIPDSVANIGSSVFHGCSSLEKIAVGKGNKKYEDMDGVLFEKKSSSLNLMTYPANRKETVYTIPKKVTSIGSGAFSDCSSLTDIIIPNSVKSIGSNAFSDCNSLTDLTIPSSVKEIEYVYGSFWGCDSLKNLKMSVKKGNKIYAKVILDDGADMRKPTITSQKTEVATVSKPVYKTDEIGETAAKVAITAKNKGKTNIVFQRTSRKNKKIKVRITLTVK